MDRTSGIVVKHMKPSQKSPRNSVPVASSTFSLGTHMCLDQGQGFTEVQGDGQEVHTKPWNLHQISPKSLKPAPQEG